MRRLVEIGTPRALQGRVVALRAVLSLLWTLIDEALEAIWAHNRSPTALRRFATQFIPVREGHLYHGLLEEV